LNIKIFQLASMAVSLPLYGSFATCHKLFGLNCDVTVALINFLRHFQNTGIYRYQGEYVALAKKELIAVCSQLCEVKALPQETPVDLLAGLTICSVELFKSLFVHKL